MSDDQGPNMEMRAFVAVVLSLAVMIGYQYFFAPPPPEPGAELVIEEPVESPLNETPGAPPAVTEEEQVAAGGEEQEPAPLEAIVAEQEEQVVFGTERYRMTISNRGGRISSLVLNDFASDFGGPLELVVDGPGFEPAGMFTLASPEQPSVAAEANEALYQVTVNGFEPRSSQEITEPTEVRWQWADGNGWSVDKKLTINPRGYLSTLEISVESPYDTPIFVTLGPGLEMEANTSRAGIYLMSGAVLFDGASVEHVASADLFEPQLRLADLAWGGIQSKYFLAAFVAEARVSAFLAAIPAPEEPEGATEIGEAQDTGPLGEPGTRAYFGIGLPRGVPIQLPVYVGPKDYSVLAAEGFGLERAVDYGRFRILARPVAVVLETLYDFTGNYGIAIILATLGVRLLFFPLSQSSMKSMRKMQQLQPQMNAIKARYKGVKDTQKRQEMNTEVMQLYKDNGVSPLGGCLPMLLQMPVLFGFYAAISVSIISRQAPFILWIKDLSMMDPFYVLPLMMGASMFLQQRMSPQAGDPMQQKIFRLMPVMFTFFFLTFPSGLVIYWLCNTVLGIAQQKYVNHQMGPPSAKATAGPASNKGQKKGGGGKRKKRGKK